MQEAKSCGFLIVRKKRQWQFLLMKHKDRWDLPKGHVDPGETDMECALRELFEETGITAGDIDVHPQFAYTNEYVVQKKRYGDEPVNKTLIIYLGTLQKDVKIKCTEHPDYKWFAWDPPHVIQQKTIDPLLEYAQPFLVETFTNAKSG